MSNIDVICSLSGLTGWSYANGAGLNSPFVFFFFNPNFVRLQFGLSQSGVKDEETILEHSNRILNVTLRNQKESDESLLAITWGEPWILLFCFINDLKPISEKRVVFYSR